LLDRLRRILRSGLRVLGVLAFLAPLASRIAVGLAFQQTGQGKWTNLENTTTFFRELGIPYPEANAVFIALLEWIGGMALIAGLFTRVFAAGLASTMAVALLTADKERFLESWTSADFGPTDVTAFVYLLFLSWLVFYGPGAASLDALLRRLFRIDAAPKPPEPARE
jgi:putative oxidoreductase